MMIKSSLALNGSPSTGKIGKPVTYPLKSHITLFGPAGTGKGATLEIPNLTINLFGTSIFSIDPSGQNAAVTAQARRLAGCSVLALNPYGMHTQLYPDLESCGFNPLSILNPKNDDFAKLAKRISAASIPVAAKGDPHWPMSSRGLWTWIIMYVKVRDGDKANLATVRDLLMEPEETKFVDKVEIPVSGLRATAAKAVSCGHPSIRNLASRYTQTLERN